MKQLLLIIILGISIPAFSQKTKVDTASFQVKGVCDMCKERIENAAYIKGVKFCDWNKETRSIQVVFVPEKVTLDKIHESIALAGHETDKINADFKAYNSLPKCCAYNNGVDVH